MIYISFDFFFFLLHRNLPFLYLYTDTVYTVDIMGNENQNRTKKESNKATLQYLTNVMMHFYYVTINKSSENYC